MMYSYAIVDVFTDEALKGNPEDYSKVPIACNGSLF